MLGPSSVSWFDEESTARYGVWRFVGLHRSWQHFFPDTVSAWALAPSRAHHACSTGVCRLWPSWVFVCCCVGQSGLLYDGITAYLMLCKVLP